MSQYARIVLLPLIVIAVVAAIILGIGNLLLAVGKGPAVPLAFGIATAVLAIATFIATRKYEAEA